MPHKRTTTHQHLHSTHVAPLYRASATTPHDTNCTSPILSLLCAFLFKNTSIRDYPTYEIGLLFLFAYGSYALAEAVELSGIMALFFCGIVLAHYNSYNLSETAQVGAEVIFQSLAHVAETFVFLYMGMGLFTGQCVPATLSSIACVA